MGCHSRARGNPESGIENAIVQIPCQARNDNKNRMLKSGFRVKHGMTKKQKGNKRGGMTRGWAGNDNKENVKGGVELQGRK